MWCGVCIVIGSGCQGPLSHPDMAPAAAGSLTSTGAGTNEPLRFVVRFPPQVHSNAVDGRVILFLSREPSGEPRFASAFSRVPQPFFAVLATNWQPGSALVFWPSNFNAPDALAFPEPMSRLEAGTYRAQVLVDVEHRSSDFNESAGNLYSRPLSCQLRGARGGAIGLTADQVVHVQAPKDTDWVKLVEIRSELLSRFHRRDVMLRAAVILPFGYTNDSRRRFPAVYVIPGFGGRHTSAWDWMESADGKAWQKGENPLRALSVTLDPDVPLGHSVCANSANNGPVGDAVVQELIPEIERRFRAIAEPRARLVTGHSSGGWASLWLQVAYPGFFGGCWSTSPDPVDFRAFQTMNLYEDRNGHWTREGQPRPVARARDRPSLTFQQMNRAEYVLGEGGQLDSFNAVFSPRGPDGRPRPVMDKLSGAIDREVVEYWKRYDIGRVLRENWSALWPTLQGKLHVIGAGWDTFYLDPAVVLLKDFLDTVPHGGYVELHPGDHGSVITPALRQRIRREMADQLAREVSP
jgi:hypothetical protein